MGPLKVKNGSFSDVGEETVVSIRWVGPPKS
jgi:hypothetical protein